MTKFDEITKPSHYNWLPGIECDQVAQHFNFFCGMAIKYIWRHGHKDTAIKDLRKAIVCLEKEIERIEKYDLSYASNFES